MEKKDKIINRTLYGVDVVIFDNLGRVFMLERDVKDEKFKTGWEFVKGALKINEDFLDAALREIREETNLEVQLIGEIAGIMKVDARYRRKPAYDFVEKKAFVFICTGGQVLLDMREHKNYQWMTFEESIEKVWVDFGKEILEEAKKLFDASFK